MSRLDQPADGELGLGEGEQHEEEEDRRAHATWRWFHTSDFGNEIGA